MSKDIMSSMLKQLGNEYAVVAEDGTPADVEEYIDTGSYTLNAVISGSLFGGIPTTTVTALAGEEATGKTFFAIDIVKNFLNKFPGGVVIYFESERAVSKKLLKERGVDVSRVIISPINTVEKFKTQAVKMANANLALPEEKRPRMMFVVDSLGMLSSEKEMADSEEGKNVRDMTRAQQVKSAFRTLTLNTGTARIPILITNHVYVAIGQMYADKDMGGGAGLKYAASTVVYLSKAKARGEDLGEGSAAKNVVGSIITARAKKSRMTIENTKVQTMLAYASGLSRYYGLFDLAYERSGILTKEGTKYVFPDGTKAFKKEILAEPAKYFTQEFLETLDVWVKDNFTYSNVTEDSVINELIKEDAND